MSISCDLVLQWGATPEQLRELGSALWRWCQRLTGNAGIYQFVDSQPLADLIAGRFPASGRLWFRDESSADRQATIDSLRREIPGRAVANLVVDGKSWS